MTSKRLFSWSKRQSTAEPYYKTGGLLPIECIETESSNNEAKVRPGRLRDELALHINVFARSGMLMTAGEACCTLLHSTSTL